MVGNGSHDPRISSLDEARRRKLEAERAAKAAPARAAGGTPKQKIVGIVFVVMAIGYIAWMLGAFGGATVPAGIAP